MSRQQLYDEVWEKPTYKVAMKYGLSDVGLAKICKRNNIPKPPLGYWAKLAHGHKVEQPELPQSEEEKPIAVKTMNARLGIEDPGLLERAEELVAYEKRDENKIVVPDELTKPHSIIVEAKRTLRSASKERDGLYYSACWPGIAVTKPLIPRALLIMDTLLKALEKRGYDLDEFKVVDEPATFRLQEYLQSTLTEYAKRNRQEGDFYRSTSDYERLPSGRLQLHTPSPFIYSGDGLRQNWTDGKTQRVEYILNDFICGLIRRAAANREYRLEHEREEREWKAEQERREEIARQKAMERARKERLRSNAHAWEKSNILRRYIDAVLEKDGPIKPGSELEKWVAWARAEADEDDPLVNEWYASFRTPRTYPIFFSQNPAVDFVAHFQAEVSLFSG